MSVDLELVATQVDETPTVMLPLTGAVVDLTKPVEVARALQDVRDMKRYLDDFRGLLEGVLRLEAQRQGTKTLHLGDVDAVVSGGEKAEYDTELLQELLRAAGLPEERCLRLLSRRSRTRLTRWFYGALRARTPRMRQQLKQRKRWWLHRGMSQSNQRNKREGKSDERNNDRRRNTETGAGG
jgi:hypothetical protein